MSIPSRGQLYGIVYPSIRLRESVIMISNGDVRRHLDFQNEDRKGNHEMSGAWDSAMELILKELEQGFHFPYSLRHDVHTPSRNDKRGFCVNDRILFDSCFEVVLCRCLSGTSLTRKFSIPIDFLLNPLFYNIV